MKVTWQRTALDDIRNPRGGVPPLFRGKLREYLRALRSTKAGVPCTDSRYADCYFVKFKYWFVMYRIADDEHIDVLAVQYDYSGESP